MPSGPLAGDTGLVRSAFSFYRMGTSWCALIRSRAGWTRSCPAPFSPLDTTAHLVTVSRRHTPMKGLVRLTDNHILLLAGSPRGQDQVNQLVSSWAGWRRLPGDAALHTGERVSTFHATPWASSIVPLLEQTQISLEYAPGVEGRLMLRMDALQRIKEELDPPPGHQANLQWEDEWGRYPMPHQRMALRALKHMDYRAILADDMGLGKTATAIWAWQQSGAPRLLVICPKTVKLNWRREIRLALKTETAVFVIDGTAKQRANQVGYMRHFMDPHPVGAIQPLPGRAAAIINYDLLHRLPEREADILADWTEGQFLVCDESHYIKNKKAERTKFVLNRLAGVDHGATARLCLTGTPIRNTTEDLWAQIQVIRPGVWNSFNQFEKLHLVRSKMQIEVKGGRQVTLNPVRGTKNREQLNAVVNTLQVRRKKEDVLDLPPKVFTYPEFELDKPTAKIYNTMKDFALIELAELGDDTPIFAPGARSAIEATLRLEQIAQGFLGGIPEPYLEKVTPLIAKNAEKIEGRPGQLVFPHSSKLEWICEAIDTVLKQGGQPVIFSRFNTPLFWLVEQWEDAAMLHGGLTTIQRTEIIDSFQNHGIRVMFCQVKVAEGFNLTASQDVLFYGRDWSPAVNAQATDRCHRIGQAGTVNVQIPIVVGTFEEYLHKKLKSKAEDADVALKDMTIGELREAL